MAEKGIIQNMILQLGQSQDERLPPELHADFARVDERSRKDLMLLAKKLAASTNFYQTHTAEPAGNWERFFPFKEANLNDWLNPANPEVPPHLALFIAFLGLYKQPQRILNGFTGRHLDFYYERVLRLQPKSAVPDKAHVLLELKKNSRPIRIAPADLFSAGKDSTGTELIYTPTFETVVNTATVQSLRSLFRDDGGHGTVRFAPVANSSDGVGGDLDEDNPKWRGFGHAGLPPAEVGFAVASPVLRMREGVRKITLELTLTNAESTRLNNTSLQDAFDIYITGEKNWITLDTLSITITAGLFKCECQVPAGEKAVVDYSASIHGYQYTARAPLIQLLLKPGSNRIGYGDFNGVTVTDVKVSVDVSGVTSLALESDEGALDPKKAFVPFGPQPTSGSRFMVGCEEALSKKLSELSIKVQWKDVPSNFSTRYANYGVSVTNNSFTAQVSFTDATEREQTNSGVKLFQSTNATLEQTFTFSPGLPAGLPGFRKGSTLFALAHSGSVWGAHAAGSLILKQPVLFPFRNIGSEPRPGFVTFRLERDFLHSTYRQKYVEHVMKYSRSDTSEPNLIILNEPYTPTVQSISLAYKAHSDRASLVSATPEDFSNLDAQFFHIAYFGQRREHAYQRGQFGFVTDKRVSLLPSYENEGELLIGFSNLKPRDSISALFQVAEGSADPDLSQQDLTWSVLCDNYWKPLGTDAVVRDTTNQLLTSGLIQFVIPAEATTQNTILPAGQIWLRAGLVQNVSAVCQLIDVVANAVEVRFTDKGNAPVHLATALDAGKITRLKKGLPDVKTVSQRYASFGGRPLETSEPFHCRVAERLRHKARCITPWDYERLILEAFPKVHKVKCIPHAKEGSWLAPGNVMLVVVPDLKNKNAMNPLEPKVDADTISRIGVFVRERAGMWAQMPQVTVKNPAYQKLQLNFKVKFRTGYEFNFYSEQLKRQLIEFLSPWAFAADRDISFGGKVYRSVLLDFVEDLEPVDYVTDFRMFTWIGSSPKVDVNEAQPQTPDSILVSDTTHVVNAVD